MNEQQPFEAIRKSDEAGAGVLVCPQPWSPA